MPTKSPSHDPKENLLHALTHHVRVLTVDQVARTWWPHTKRPRNNAKKRLQELENQKLVSLQTILARPEIDLEEPVFNWKIGDPKPDFGPIAYRLKARWKEPLEPTDVVIASRDTKLHYGGYIGGRMPRESEATHDINLAKVYLQFRQEQPELLDFWVSEAQQYAEGGGKNQRLPDVIIRDGEAVQMIIEFAGAYSKQKLQAFHDEAKQIPYQLW